MQRTERREQKIRWVLDRRQPDLAMIAENIHDPHNVSAILRTADSVGVSELALLYNQEQAPNFKKQGKRSSSGARKWIYTPKFKTVADCFARYRGKGFKIYASALAERTVSLYDLDFTVPVVILFGNENRGISEEAAAGADEVFNIPMVGMVQSLNVSVAAAVTLYEAYRQRMSAGFYAERRLPDAEFEELQSAWREK